MFSFLKSGSTKILLLLYRIITTLILIVPLLAWSCGVIGTSVKSGIILCLFFLPVLWVGWCVCVLLDTGRERWHLLALWLGIDCAALIVLNSLIGSAQPLDGPMGDDFALVVAFFPLALPALFAGKLIPFIGMGMVAISRGAEIILLPEIHSGLVAGWLGFSIMTGVSSWIFVIFSRHYLLPHRKNSA